MDIERPFGEAKQAKNPDEALLQLAAWKEQVAYEIRNEMVKNGGLSPEATVTIESAHGLKIAKIFISEKGILTTATLCANGTYSVSHESINDTHEQHLESTYRNEHASALRDYLTTDKSIYPLPQQRRQD